MSNKKELLQEQFSLLLKGRKALDLQLDTYKVRFDSLCREIHKIEQEITMYEKNLLFLEAKLRKEHKTKPIDIPAPKVIPFEKLLPLPEPELKIESKDIKDDDVGECPCVFESLYIPSEPDKKTFFKDDDDSDKTTEKVVDFDSMSDFKPELDKVASVGWFVKVWTEQEFEGAIIKLQKKQLKLKTTEGIINIPYYMIQDWERINFE